MVGPGGMLRWLGGLGVRAFPPIAQPPCGRKRIRWWTRRSILDIRHSDDTQHPFHRVANASSVATLLPVRYHESRFDRELPCLVPTTERDPFH
jgi:hypothetical protein